MLKELLIMPLWGIGLMFFSAFLLFAFAHYISKSRHPFKRSLLSMAIGILTLIAVNLTGSFTGVYLPVSLVSVCCAAFGGVPGVTLMLGLNLFFKSISVYFIIFQKPCKIN